MNINVELDQDLLDRACVALVGKSINEVVEEGLRRIVAERALHELADSIGEMSKDPEQRKLMLNVRDRAW